MHVYEPTLTIYTVHTAGSKPENAFDKLKKKHLLDFLQSYNKDKMHTVTSLTSDRRPYPDNRSSVM